MSTRMHGSEEALADLAYDRLATRSGSRVLVGGLGMGFTAAAALARCGDAGSVVIAELVPKVVEWNRGVLAAAAGRPLDDPRTSIELADVADVMRRKAAVWDGILLDVDNGPSPLSQDANQWLYTRAGLKAAWRALKPGGVLTVWSANDDSGFTRRLEAERFAVTVHRVRARGVKRGPRHVVWCAQKRA